MSHYKLVNENHGKRHDLPRPSHITDFSSTFGTAEVEDVAANLVAFFQLSDTWKSFTLTELMNFYKLNGWNHDLMFYGLTGALLHCDGMFWHEFAPEPYLVFLPDGSIEITESFVKTAARNVVAEDIA